MGLTTPCSLSQSPTGGEVVTVTTKNPYSGTEVPHSRKVCAQVLRPNNICASGVGLAGAVVYASYDH
ncbi:Uncharacterized protein FWK35_00024258 [Aphis craccivora]|uniref:Uncharacterized protein n=1 Tax=Aphis craccivora TaxID=307492 RepID=A0A6G0X6R6_APHCR|nr:Uncharacterized protein FWK35_00024258 [Aphis craccivora]